MNSVTIYERRHYYTRLIWLFPLVYVLHILEESNGFTEWVTNVIGGEMTFKPFLINNAIFMVVNICCCILAMRKRKMWTVFILFLWMSAQEFWNFVNHIYTEYRFNAYSPGYFTAIFLYLPTYFYLSYITLREGFLSWKLWLLAFVIGPIGLAVTIWGGLYHFQPFPWHMWF